MIIITVFSANLLAAIALCTATKKINVLCYIELGQKMLNEKNVWLMYLFFGVSCHLTSKIRTFMKSVLWRLPLSSNSLLTNQCFIISYQNNNTFFDNFLHKLHSLKFILGHLGSVAVLAVTKW